MKGHFTLIQVFFCIILWTGLCNSYCYVSPLSYLTWKLFSDWTSELNSVMECYSLRWWVINECSETCFLENWSRYGGTLLGRSFHQTSSQIFISNHKRLFQAKVTAIPQGITRWLMTYLRDRLEKMLLAMDNTYQTSLSNCCHIHCNCCHNHCIFLNK